VITGVGHNQVADYWSFGLVVYEMLSGINPFKLKNKTKYEKLQMITEKDVAMMQIFSAPAISLLTGLLNRNVSPLVSHISAITAVAEKTSWKLGHRRDQEA
jgi:serine/threonine protein kinase